MTLNSFETLAAANKQAAEAFMQMSKICLEGAERLLSLNLAAMREVMEDSAAVAGTLTDIKSMQDFQAIQPDVAPMMEKAVAYTRNVQEIATRTQDELSKLMNVQFAQFDLDPQAPAAWNAAMEMFTKGAQKAAPATVKAAAKPARKAA